MLEILQFYVSSFWVWLGLTIGMVAVLEVLSSVVSNLFRWLR